MKYNVRMYDISIFSILASVAILVFILCLPVFQFINNYISNIQYLELQKYTGIIINTIKSWFLRLLFHDTTIECSVVHQPVFSM